MAKKWYESGELVDVVIDDQPEKLLSEEKVSEEELEKGLLKAILPTEDAQLGFGCNTFSGISRGKVLMVDGEQVDPGLIQGQERWFYLGLINSKHELNEKMEVSASASYSGLANISAKSKFVNEQHLNSQSVYLLVKTLVTNSQSKLKSYKPTENFAVLISQQPIDWDRFISKYGNEFIYSIKTGGEFYALYEFHTSSLSQKKALEIQVEASGWGAKAEGDFQKSLDKIDTNVTITCKLFIRGGKGKFPDVESDKIIQAAINFPTYVEPKEGAPVAYQAITKDYNVIDEFPGYPKEINDRLKQNDDIFHDVTRQLAVVDDLKYALNAEANRDDTTKHKLADIKDKLLKEVREIAESPLDSHPDPTPVIQEIDSIKEKKTWQMIQGQKLTQVSVGSSEYIWGVSADNHIWQRKCEQNIWEKIDGSFKNVSVGADGTVWGISKKGNIYRWDVNKMTKIGGGLKQISVGNSGHVWGINGKGDVYERKSNKWVIHTNKSTGKFDLLSVGTDGTVYLLKDNHQVFQWDEDKVNFNQVKGELSYVTVADASEVWGIDIQSQVVRWDGKTWKPLASTRKLKSISVGDDGTVWGVDGQGDVFRYHLI